MVRQRRPRGDRQKGLSRREFLEGLTLWGGVALLSSFLPACLKETRPPPETSSPAPAMDVAPPTSEKNAVSRIALVRTGNRTEGVPKAINLLESNPVQGKAVALKPNFNTADPFPGSTHNDTLRALVLALQEMGAMRITLAERSGPANTQEVMQQKGTFQMGKDLGFDVINLEELGPEGWVHLHPRDSHWEQGFHFARVYLEAERIVQTCCLKTHAYGGHFTLSLKNSVGMLPRSGYPYMSELHGSPYQRQMIAEINTAYSPDLILLDGVEAFVNGGPMRGTRADAGVILAGSDRIAIDAAGVAILRLLGTTPEVSRGPVFEQEQLARAVELGLGIHSPAQIRFVTDDTESEDFARRVEDILLEG